MFAVLAAAAEYELELRRTPGRRHRCRPAPPGRRPDAARQEAHRPPESDRPGRDRHAPPPGRRRRLGHPGRPHPENLPLHHVRRTRHHTLTRRKVPPATRHARDIRRDGFGRAGSARRTPDFSAPGPGVSSQTVIARRSPTRDIRRSARAAVAWRSSAEACRSGRSGTAWSSGHAETSELPSWSQRWRVGQEQPPGALGEPVLVVVGGPAAVGGQPLVHEGVHEQPHDVGCGGAADVCSAGWRVARARRRFRGLR